MSAILAKFSIIGSFRDLHHCYTFAAVRPCLAFSVLFVPARQSKRLNAQSVGNLRDLDPFLAAHLNGADLELVRIKSRLSRPFYSSSVGRSCPLKRGGATIWITCDC